ncbi:MAG: undecaprenyl/decaprenyl-phosphate alpha-N-acetylglucosaminyl 1-phosphate transferase [Acidobacteria bacterium]|nr:undecaprenyl/decaprenyl-phosphate alpha-N-acetylglucosaminyl 1-phosphate transferase [Acidobacteriota bacterium]
MRSYVTLFLLSFIAALLLTPIVRRKATEWGAIAVPDGDNGGRHIHANPTPKLGGIAIYLAFMATLACVPLLTNMVGDIFRANLPRLLMLLAPATLIFLFGIYDDFRNVGAPEKVIVQTLAAAMIFIADFRIENISSPFGGHWHLPLWLSFLLTAVWIVGITNAFNLIDGIDGLAAGASVFALLSILVFSVAQGNPEISQLAIVLVGAVLGFLRFNFNPATIFLGDSGSLFLGFMAAALSLAGSQKGSTIVAIAIPLISFGLPVTEAGLSLARRFVSGQSLLAGDRGHIHHKLLQQGLTQRKAVILLYAVCAMFSLFGLMLLNPKRSLAALIFFVLGVGILFGVQRLRYAEFAELGNQIRQGVTQRRRSLAVNVKVRRASEHLGRVQTSAQLFAALESMLETNEFDSAVLDLNVGQFLIGQDNATHTIWSWKREDAESDGTLPADRFADETSARWMLSLPLTDEAGKSIGLMTFHRNLAAKALTIDLQHLCGEFQRELSAALLRVSKEQLQTCIGINSGSS